MTILAVDPRSDHLKLLAECIRENHSDAEIQTFTDPMLAFKFGVNNPVDSVYTVISMSRLTGFELVKMLRELYPQIKTNYVDQTDHFRRDAMRLAAYTYLVEPLTPELLRNAEAQAAREEAEFEGI